MMRRGFPRIGRSAKAPRAIFTVGRWTLDVGRSTFAQRSAFTLVEMLVSVALVVVMMLMFTQIFELATDSMGTQRGIAQNDRRGRTLTNVFKRDLENRTFRVLIPFARGEYFQGVDPRLSQRQGYFYISENDPTDDRDDVLQFTVRSSNSRKTLDDTPYISRATLMGLQITSGNLTPGNSQVWSRNTQYFPGDLIVPATATSFPYVYRCVRDGVSGDAEPAWSIGAGTTVVDGATRWVVANANQPEWDDGFGNNGSASSSEAEVSYFLRNGNLYRRVLPIRQAASGDPQPQNDLNGQDFFDSSANDPINTTFWNAFDYSAHFSPVGARLHGSASLLNKTLATVQTWKPDTTYRQDDIVMPFRVLNQLNFLYRCNVITPTAISGRSRSDEPNWPIPPSLGGNPIADGPDLEWEALEPQSVSALNPQTLTGGLQSFPLGVPYHRFGFNYNDGTPVGGKPREFINGVFIGRFTLEETSHPDFLFPHRQSRIGGTGALINSGNPFTNADPLNFPSPPINPLTVGSDGVVDQYRGGARRGEDILMTNVLGFDVQVWDDGLINDAGPPDSKGNANPFLGDQDDRRGGFVNIGYAPLLGALALSQSDINNVSIKSGYFTNQARGHGNLVNQVYGPHPLPQNATDPDNNVFDTWHPSITAADPPFRPMLMFIDPLVAPNSSPKANSYTLDRARLRGTWSVDPFNAPSSDDPTGGVYVTGQYVLPTKHNGLAFIYRATVEGNGIDPAQGTVLEPKWPTTAGESFFSSLEDTNQNGAFDYVDQNNNGQFDSGEPSEDLDNSNSFDGIRWTAVPNLIPLRAIRIVIRYHDVRSDQIRQLTLVQSLVD